MVSQILFGEHFEILEKQPGWLKVKLAFDHYEGWIIANQCEPVSLIEYNKLNKEQYCVSFDLVQIMILENSLFSIVLGSSMPHFKDHTCRLGDTAYRFEGNVKCPEKLQTTKGIMENAYMYLHSPYLWGGRTPFGIDCSGFTQMVYKLAGIRLKRDASQQAAQGTLINLLDEAKVGDLAFFDNDEGKITHVGILLPNNQIIHSSGKVRIDSLDHHGIFNQESKKYTHNLRLLKRFV